MTRLPKSLKVEAYSDGAVYSVNTGILLKLNIDRPTILLQYPKNFTPVCTSELIECRDRYQEFQNLGLQLMAGSLDSPECHQVFFGGLGDMPYPIITLPRIKALDQYIADNGYPQRSSLFIKQGQIIDEYTTDSETKRSIDKILDIAKHYL